MKVISNQEGEYSGVYMAHCEDERIVIAVGKFMGVESRHESWMPEFPPKFLLHDEGHSFNSPKGQAFTISFLGTPGELGVYGYKGCCQRKVTIREVLLLR